MANWTQPGTSPRYVYDNVRGKSAVIKIRAGGTTEKHLHIHFLRYLAAPEEGNKNMVISPQSAPPQNTWPHCGGKHDAYWFTTCSLRRWPHEYQSLLQGDQLWLTGLEGKHTSLVKSLTECEQALLTSRWAQTFSVWEKYILMLTSSCSLCTDLSFLNKVERRKHAKKLRCSSLETHWNVIFLVIVSYGKCDKTFWPPVDGV